MKTNLCLSVLLLLIIISVLGQDDVVPVVAWYTHTACDAPD